MYEYYYIAPKQQLKNPQRWAHAAAVLARRANVNGSWPRETMTSNEDAASRARGLVLSSCLRAAVDFGRLGAHSGPLGHPAGRNVRHGRDRLAGGYTAATTYAGHLSRSDESAEREREVLIFIRTTCMQWNTGWSAGSEVLSTISCTYIARHCGPFGGRTARPLDRGARDGGVGPGSRRKGGRGD